ncbi:hypothetical protein [uncultured Psychroserpens sp.]|uniref:hypothetical protein n=1 Tax=uncultured Psychroserpens sp. TaxID=255436 RepID=UPI002639C2BC|nr:hypothetical protein [uncultured Psychroserpens sp.]
MRVINIHKRTIHQSEVKVSGLFKTLATSEDDIWPKDKWPAIRFKNGLRVGNSGGHGRIRYTVIEFVPGKHIKFEFNKPDNFTGTHELKIYSLDVQCTEIVHKIEMDTTSIKATLLWCLIIRWLHDALIEDAFDNVENYFFSHKKDLKYSLWVILLRQIYKRKSFKIKQA